MENDVDILNQAIQFLIEGQEQKAAEVLQTCKIDDLDIVDSWMDGNKQLDGMLVELTCPRSSYDILIDSTNPITQSIKNAIDAVMPSDSYVKTLNIRAVSGLQREHKKRDDLKRYKENLKQLVLKIESQKDLMIAVATGGPRIQQKNNIYKEIRIEIKSELMELGIDDPNPYSDLWNWYGRWSEGSLPTYQSRRNYITNLYKPLLNVLELRIHKDMIFKPREPTGWTRVDRNVDKINEALERAKNEEDFQGIGLLCREAIISLAQAVYDVDKDGAFDGVIPSDTDAKRMLDSFLSSRVTGKSNELQRKFAKAAFQLAVGLQHRRTASFKEAALCAEATRAIINTISIVEGKRDLYQ